MLTVILSRAPVLTVPLLSTYGTTTLLSRDGEEVKVPLAPLLGASPLVRSMVAESHLHPGTHGPLVLSFTVPADVLVSVGDMLGTGVSNVVEENIKEVVQVLNSLRVEANLSQIRINNEYEYVPTNEEDIKQEDVVFEPANDKATSIGGNVYLATDNSLNVATNVEDIIIDTVLDPASVEESSSDSDNDEAMDYSLKECYVNIEKVAVCSPHQSCHSTVEKPYKCSICSYSCSSPSKLKRHRRTHFGQKPFTCKICNLSFSQNCNLRTHERIHTGEKPFTCKICNLSFSQKIILRHHERIHTGEKPYKCKICSFSCITSSDLKLHVRIHTGERPYTCKICNSSFSRSSTLRNHLRIHTGEKNRGV